MQSSNNSNSSRGSNPHLTGLEQQLRDLWSQYVGCIEKYGFNEKAEELKKKYFQLYNSYRNNKK